MTSAESSLQKVIYEYSIFLKPEHVEIVNRIYNTAPFERSLAVWSITRLETAALSQIRIPPERSDPPEKLRFFSRGNIALMKKENNAILLNPTIARSSKMDVAELRCWSMTNEIVSKDKSGNSLTIRYQDSSGDLYGEYPVHVFLNQRFTEIESHSEYLMLNPGEAVLLREVWNVH